MLYLHVIHILSIPKTHYFAFPNASNNHIHISVGTATQISLYAVLIYSCDSNLMYDMTFQFTMSDLTCDSSPGDQPI